jgi:hypothetical protein
MTVRMKIHLHLLTFLQMSPLNMNLHQHHHFPDGSIQHEKQLVILSVILQINIIHIHSSSEPPLFWLKFQRLMIQTHLQKLLGHPDWDTTMNEEYHSLMENDTWDLVPLPKGRKLVRCKWVYRTKYASDGSVERHKAQLVSKGFSQVEGIDYNETFSPIAKMNSIHLVLALVASHKWEVHQMDVKSTFLHGDLQEEIYMEQPPGYVQNDSSLVCHLKKSLYGLKQALELGMPKWIAFFLTPTFLDVILTLMSIPRK